MAKKNDTAQDATALAAGVSAGLQLWLFFLICFVLLKYPVPLSIFLGAIGGLAGGWVVTWWKSKDLPLAQPIPQETIVEESRNRFTRNRLGKRDKKYGKKYRPLISRRWLFGKKQSPSNSKDD